MTLSTKEARRKPLSDALQMEFYKCGPLPRNIVSADTVLRISADIVD